MHRKTYNMMFTAERVKDIDGKRLASKRKSVHFEEEV